jgi:hypothetical protein
VARGTQLLALVQDLREEIGRSNSVAVGKSDLPGLQQKLRRTQEMLYDDYDWPFLRQIFPALTLNAGQQYYDFPAGLHLERVEAVDIWYSNFPQPLVRGITPAQYAIYNSLAGVRQEPAMRWDVQWTGTAEQMEIWPIPVSNAQYVTFTGIRNLRPLIADSDVADLDDQLIVLWTAAEILGRQGDASAGLVTKLAQSRLGTVKKRVKGAERVRRMGMESTDTDGRIPIVVHARAS